MARASDPSRQGFRRGLTSDQRLSQLTADDLVARFTGRGISPEDFIATNRNRKAREEASAAIAAMLEEGGIQVEGSSCAAVGLVTGQAINLTSYRASHMIPVVAHRERAPITNALCYHIQQNPLNRLLSFVVTTRARCTVTTLRSTISDLGRWVSRWSSRAKAMWGVDVLLRVSEFTIDPAVDPTGPAYFVHAHVVLCVPRTWTSPRDDTCSKFIDWSKRALKVEVLDLDLVEAPSSMVRYVAKPPFMNGNAEAAQLPRTPAEAVVLFGAVAGLKLVQPLGSFKALMHQIRQDRLRVVRLVDEEGAPYELVPYGSRKSLAALDARQSGRASAQNRVLSVASPRPLITRYAEPVAFVSAYDAEAFVPPSRVGGIATGDLIGIWKRNGAPDPKVAVAEAIRLRERTGFAPASSGHWSPLRAHEVLPRSSTVQPSREHPERPSTKWFTSPAKVSNNFAGRGRTGGGGEFSVRPWET